MPLEIEGGGPVVERWADRPRAVGQPRRLTLAETESGARSRQRNADSGAGGSCLRARAGRGGDARGRSVPLGVRGGGRTAAARRQRRGGPLGRAVRRRWIGGAGAGRRERVMAQARPARSLSRHPPRDARAGRRDGADADRPGARAGEGRGRFPLPGGSRRAAPRRGHGRALGLPHGGRRGRRGGRSPGPHHAAGLRRRQVGGRDPVAGGRPQHGAAGGGSLRWVGERAAGGGGTARSQARRDPPRGTAGRMGRVHRGR